jgi:dTDP-4-dehydrorhamnose reductase
VNPRHPASLLVTGASGLLGANLVLAARARGHAVTALYHRRSVRFADVDARPLDLCDEGAVADLFHQVRPHTVVHCAAATAVDWCEDHPEEAHRLNAEAAGAVARGAAAVGARVAYVSTDSVFDGARGGYREDDAPMPVNTYARSKLAGEEEVRAALPGALVLRTNLYGWNAQKKQSLAEWVLGRLEAGEPVPGFTDVSFAPLLVNDLAETILDLLDRGAEGTFHLASSDACTKYEFARGVAEVFGYDPALVHPARSDSAAFRAARPRLTSLDPSRAAAVLGRPMPTVLEGLRRFRTLRDDGYVDNLKACTAD